MSVVPRALSCWLALFVCLERASLYPWVPATPSVDQPILEVAVVPLTLPPHLAGFGLVSFFMWALGTRPRALSLLSL